MILIGWEVYVLCEDVKLFHSSSVHSVKIITNIWEIKCNIAALIHCPSDMRSSEQTLWDQLNSNAGYHNALLVTRPPILGCWKPQTGCGWWKGLFALVVCVSLSRGTRRDDANDDLWQMRRGVLFSALCSCLLFIDACSARLLSCRDSIETHTAEVRR